MDVNLTNRNALVLGASKGIGKAIALELAMLGANVTIAARNEALLKETMHSLNKSLGQSHKYLVMDTADTGSLKQTIHEHLQKEKISYHILINNTGGPPPGPLAEADADALLFYFRQHVVAFQVITQSLLPGMKKAGYGRIINVISTSVKQPIKGLGVSNTIRGAVASWAKTLSFELGPYGITVNNILPGYTQTERLDALIRRKAENSGKPERDIILEMEAEIPLQRFALPSEVAAAAAFLATPAAAYINGINLPVDGGRTGCL